MAVAKVGSEDSRSWCCFQIALRKCTNWPLCDMKFCSTLSIVDMENCSVDAIASRTNGVEFAGLFVVYMYLNQTCAPGSDIFFEKTRMLTNAAYERISGNDGSIWKGWTAYSISHIWNRIVVWKLPLNLWSLLGMPGSSPEYARTWKGLAIIMISYDECGASGKVDSFLYT